MENTIIEWNEQGHPTIEGCKTRLFSFDEIRCLAIIEDDNGELEIDIAWW